MRVLKPLHNRKAFTLLEVLIAMVILAAGIMLLVNSWSGSLIMLQRTEINVEMAALLERKMAEVEAEYAGKPLSSIPEDPKEDDFGSEFPNYSWRVESKEFPMPDVGAILAAKEGGTQQMMLMVMKQFTDHLTKSVKEVRVSIIYKGHKKPITYSVTTYFVDFDRPLPMPGAQ